MVIEPIRALCQGLTMPNYSVKSLFTYPCLLCVSIVKYVGFMAYLYALHVYQGLLSEPTLRVSITSAKGSTTPLPLKVSRPEEFHLKTLAEPDGNVSAHPAPIIQLSGYNAPLSNEQMH